MYPQEKVRKRTPMGIIITDCEMRNSMFVIGLNIGVMGSSTGMGVYTKKKSARPHANRKV